MTQEIINEVLYMIYQTLNVCSFLISITCFVSHVKSGELRSNNFKTLLHLQFSTLMVALISLSGYFSVLYIYSNMAQCMLLTSCLIWIAFVSYLTDCNQHIKWPTSSMIMMVSSYFVPLAIYLIICCTAKPIMKRDQLFYTLDFTQLDEVYVKIFYGTFVLALPIVLMIYSIVNGFTSIIYLKKVNQIYSFFGFDILLQKIIPTILFVLIIPFFILQNIFMYFEEDSEVLDLIIDIVHICEALGLVIIALYYGINPTLQKSTAVSHLAQFRSNMEQKYQNKAEGPRNKSSSLTEIQLTQSAESDLSRVDLSRVLITKEESKDETFDNSTVQEKRVFF